MSISIKSKLYIGLGLLAGFVILLWISGSVFINTLARNSGAIIQDNIRSVTYAQQMEQALNDLYTAQVTAIGNSGARNVIQQDSYQQAKERFEQAFERQQVNLTETGEQELISQLQTNYKNLLNTFENAIASPASDVSAIGQSLTPAYHRLQQNLSQLTNMNVDAIHRKNDVAQQTASNVTIYMSIIGALCSVLGIVMLIRFPGYIVDPIHVLIKRIKEVADRKYDHKLEFHTGNEYEELAQAFNQMALKLQEYENSSLDRIMSEKKRVETVINNMGDAVIGLDAGSNILFANNKAVELLNKEKNELVGRYAPDVASGNDLFHKVFRHVRDNAESSRENQEGEASYIKTGEDEYYSVEVVPVLHNQGNDKTRDSHFGNIITLKNVTHFHELDQAKTHFISIVSHELKTPIASINMSLRLLEDKRIGTLTEEQKKLTSSIRKDVLRMKQTTSELLDLSKVETGNIRLDSSAVSPSSLLEYAFETMIMQATQQEVEININIRENLPEVQADSQKTVWVLVNLISNALRYTEANGVITLDACPATDPGYILFSVKDTGEGIRPEYLGKIFDKYFQADKSKKDKSGTGLGLSIAKEFISAQGGKIWAESELGRGSSFYFTLPKHNPEHT